MSIRSGTSSYGTIYFSDGDGSGDASDEVRGFLEYYHSTNMLSLGTNGSPRLRIDSNGSVGTAATVRCAVGGLDIASQGATNLGTLTLGASGGANGTNRTSAVENQFRIMTPTYADPSNMFTVMYGASGSSSHEINYGGGTGWAYAANLHRWFTAANKTTGTGTERLRIHSGGDVEVKTGSLIIGTAGEGIDFSATGGPNNGTGSSERLEDYEEGTFSPIWTSSNGNGTFQYSTNAGRYTKIGNIVTCAFYIRTTDCSALPTGSYAYMGNLPFTSVNEANGSADGATVHFNWFTVPGSMHSNTIPLAYVIKNTSSALMGSLGANSIAGVNPTNMWGSSTFSSQGYYAYGQVTYETA
tara:strand:- start:45 stop:1112 length:1068 start_codon:yes stop_codon:yes gene_type:complete